MPEDRVGRLAPTPPMGWNSWDCFGSVVTEDQVKGQADYMAAHLKQFGWQYIVIDIRWCEPRNTLFEPLSEDVVRDEYGRYQPAVNRFPSSRDGRGFTSIADYIHSKGLKFGIHIMRGIPRKAVELKEKVEGTLYTADQVANVGSISAWNPDNYGVAVNKPGGQEYYDSIVRLYASWGVDFIKADDMSTPYSKGEIQALADAIAKCGRDIVLSLSPGEADLNYITHMHQVANMFRISPDFWDTWGVNPEGYAGLNGQFEYCARWAPFILEGHWPDADMLPLGHIGKNDAMGEDRQTNFTPDEQYTLMTLQAICRSPLMFGGNLMEMDDFTLALITNPEVLAVNQHSRNNRPLFTKAEKAVWIAENPESGDKYLALFNRSESSLKVGINLFDIGVAARVAVRDLWKQSEIGTAEEQVEKILSPHSCVLYRLTAV